nr:hypothetical protein [Mucilaginibacter sp. FT3.2]
MLAKTHSNIATRGTLSLQLRWKEGIGRFRIEDELKNIQFPLSSEVEERG